MTAVRSPLRAALLAVIAVGLVLLGGGLAVALGIGREDAAPSADSVDAGLRAGHVPAPPAGRGDGQPRARAQRGPGVRSLAFDISSTQTNQAGRMEGWLSLWGLQPTGGEVMAWMGADGGHAGHSMDERRRRRLMPGMATEEELAELRELSGTAFDVEFLRLMIRHHQGGLDMAVYAAEHADVDAVRRLAGTIADTQTAETTTMTELLTERGGTPLPAP